MHNPPPHFPKPAPPPNPPPKKEWWVEYVCPCCAIIHTVDMSDESPGGGEYDGLCKVCEVAWVSSAEYASMLNAS